MRRNRWPCLHRSWIQLGLWCQCIPWGKWQSAHGRTGPCRQVCKRAKRIAERPMSPWQQVRQPHHAQGIRVGASAWQLRSILVRTVLVGNVACGKSVMLAALVSCRVGDLVQCWAPLAARFTELPGHSCFLPWRIGR